MKLFFIAGEPSGDLHASNCMKAIQKLLPDTSFEFTGGPLMQSICGKEPVLHIKDMAFMGFLEVLKNLGAIRKNFKTVKEAILKFNPDGIVLVDYPGFNLRIAKWATQKGFKVYYYISPTVWAWKENRVETVKKYTRKMFVILPFEEAFYKKHNHTVHFVGHPLLDAIEEKKKTLMPQSEFLKRNNLPDKPIIAVLPGSRVQEIERMMDIMLEVRPHFPNHAFVIAASSNLPEHYYNSLRNNGVHVVNDQTYELMNYASAGIIKSGTSTLESALFNLPQVVCYKAGAVSFAIAKKLVTIKYISLVNLIMDKECVKELIQSDLTAQNIQKELNKILNDPKHREKILDDYRRLYAKLGGTGASGRIADLIIKDLNQ